MLRLRPTHNQILRLRRIGRAALHWLTAPLRAAAALIL